MSIESRFKHLERARPEGGEVEPDEARADRFEQVEEPPASVRSAAPPLAARRFSSGPAPSEELELEPEPAAGSQPFVRCCMCGADNTVHAARCAHCTAALDTGEQRVFNERLWTKARGEAAQGQTGEQAAALDAAQRQLLGVQLAREVGQQQRWQLGSGWPGNSGPGLGWKLLARVPDRRAAWAITAVALGLPVLLLALGRRDSTAWDVGIFWAVVDAVLFLPRSAWRSRRWW